MSIKICPFGHAKSVFAKKNLEEPEPAVTEKKHEEPIKQVVTEKKYREQTIKYVSEKIHNICESTNDGSTKFHCDAIKNCMFQALNMDSNSEEKRYFGETCDLFT